MNKVSITEAIITFQDWVKVKYLNRSLTFKPLSLFKHRLIKTIKREHSTNSHFTLDKITKGFLGFIPVGLLSYYIGYTTANTVNFNDFIKYLRSEDEIYSLLEQGRTVMTFMYMPGDMFSEVTHPHFHQIAHENYQ